MPTSTVEAFGLGHGLSLGALAGLAEPSTQSPAGKVVLEM